MEGKLKVKFEDSKESFQIGDIWKVDNKVWYSERLVSEVISLCKKVKEACESGNVKNLLADDILKILDYKDSKGDE